MPQLVEFYCSFNNIKDLSSLAFHENLAVYLKYINIIRY